MSTIKISKRQWEFIGKQAGWMNFNIHKPSTNKTAEAMHRDPPDFLKGWISQKLESEDSDLVRDLNAYIERYGNAPDFAKKWATQKLYNEEPESWVNRIYDYIKERGDAPSFAYGWARTKLKQEEPENLVQLIYSMIKEKCTLPYFATEWVKEKMAVKDPDLIQSVNACIQNYRIVPGFAKRWYESQR